ncbi:MAG: hypothetical protein NUV80_07300 [Candidatus Berkelbacteria bacterium]|nr:hypothetical protein [Candidatus Berkelbacteria bacterium]MCR4308327.1 hypothetical protein [Candidatus Berkelbacteria bacterium]
MKRIVFLVVAILMATVANAQYSTLGRNPMIPGGVSWQQAIERGWEPYQLQADTHLKMRGAKGEWVDAFLPKGTKMAWCPDGSERILECGNTTNRVKVVQTKTRIEVKTVTETKYEQLPPKTVYRDRDVPGPERIVYRDREVPGPERIVHKDRYQPILILAPQQQHIANLGSPTIISPQSAGIGLLSPGGGTRINVSSTNVLAQTQSQIAEAAAAAAAAAAATSSAAAVTPTSGAGTSGGSSSGSSGAAGGGGNTTGSGSH